MEKYNWVAQDEDGDIFAFGHKPCHHATRDIWRVLIPSLGCHILKGKPNSNWKESLIDLSKNDYVIEDGILTATRKHAALIHAWADGAVIQYQDPMVGWCDYEDDEVPRFTDKCNLRIKPKTKTVKFRNYVINGQVRAYNQGSSMPNPDEYSWLDKDWQEVEIEL